MSQFYRKCQHSQDLVSEEDQSSCKDDSLASLDDCSNLNSSREQVGSYSNADTNH